MNVGDGLPALRRQVQMLDPGVLGGTLLDLPGLDQFADHTADTGFFQAKALRQLRSADAVPGLDFQQGVHAGGGIVGRRQGGAQETEFTHHRARRCTDFFDQG